MKRLVQVATVLAVVMFPLIVMAQMADKAEIKEVTKKYDLGLTRRPSLPFFDLSKIDFSHSYSIGYFSGGGFSGTQGYYSGTMRYQISRPLTLTLNLGILHDPGALFGHNKFSDNALFLPSGWLDWRPSDNFRLSVGVETVPAGYNRGYYYNPGRDFYWRR